MEAFYLEIMHQIAYIDLETIEIKKKHQNFFGLTLPTIVYKLNFESTEKSLRDMFKGKIQVIKSFALPKNL